MSDSSSTNINESIRMYTYLLENEDVYNRRIHAQLPLHTSVLIYHTTVPVCNLGGPPPGFMVSSYLPTYTSRYVRARCASRTLCFSHFVFVGSGVREFGSASGLYHGSGTDCVILYRSFVPHFVECLRALFCFLPSQLFVPAVCA